MMTGEGLGEATILFYLFYAMLIVGPPLFLGHILLLSAKLWSYRSYMLFGALLAPSLLVGFLRQPTASIVVIGVLIGSLSAGTLRLMLHTPILPRNDKSLLTGRLRNHPIMAIAVVALLATSINLLMQTHIWLRLFSSPSNFSDFFVYVSSVPLAALHLTFVIWLTSLLGRRFNFRQARSSYIVAAGLSPISAIAYWIISQLRTGEWFFYMPMNSLLSLVANGWIAMAIYLNVVAPQESPAQIGLEHPNSA